MKWNLIGSISFIVGLVLAGIVSLFSANTLPPWAPLVLAVLGLIVGLLNVTEKESTTFLISGIAFLLSFQSLALVFSLLPALGVSFNTFFALMSVFVAPAIALVAIKVLFDVARDN